MAPTATPGDEMAATKKTYTGTYNGTDYTFTSTVLTYKYAVAATMKDGEAFLLDRRSNLADAEQRIARYRSRDWGCADLQIVELK